MNRFIYALGIREVGETTALNLSLHFSKIDNLIDANQEELLEINDIGPIAASYIERYFQDKNHRNIIYSLLDKGLILQTNAINSDSNFFGKTIVLTGYQSTCIAEAKPLPRLGNCDNCG